MCASCRLKISFCKPNPHNVKTEMYDVTVTICRACMTRTPPNVRRRLTGGAQVGPSEGILRHTQGQNKTSCWMRSAEVSGLIAHQAQMPQHLSCRHIYGDCQEFIFGPFSLYWSVPFKQIQDDSSIFMCASCRFKISFYKPNPKSHNVTKQKCMMSPSPSVARVWLELLLLSDGVWPAGPKWDLARGS